MNAELKEYLLFALAMVWLTSCFVAAKALGSQLPEGVKVCLAVSVALTCLWVAVKRWRDFDERDKP